MCEGVVLLKQWEQGNTGFSTTLRDPIKGSFFMKIHFFYLHSFVSPSIPYKYQKFDDVQNELLSEYCLFGYIISPVGKNVICPLSF